MMYMSELVNVYMCVHVHVHVYACVYNVRREHQPFQFCSN